MPDGTLSEFGEHLQTSRDLKAILAQIFAAEEKTQPSPESLKLMIWALQEEIQKLIRLVDIGEKVSHNLTQMELSEKKRSTKESDVLQMMNAWEKKFGPDPDRTVLEFKNKLTGLKIEYELDLARISNKS